MSRMPRVRMLPSPVPAAAAVPDDERTLLPTKDAAARLGLAAETLKRLARSGEIASIKLGKVRRFEPAVIRQYIAEHRACPAGAGWRAWADRSPTSTTRLVAAMAAELAAKDGYLDVVLRPLSALQLAGLIQLALRHPHAAASEGHAQIASTVLAAVRAYFADAPAILEVLRRGDEPPRSISDADLDDDETPEARLS